MIMRQYLHLDPVAASYLFGCGGRAAAAVVDPIGEIGPYIDTADKTGMRILYVIDTHLHADHISSGRDLAKATGAEYVLFADAAVTFPFPRRPAMAKFSSWAMSLSRSCIHRGIRPSTFHLSSPIGPVQTNHVSC